MSTFDIRLFGAIEIRHNGARLPPLRSQKALALLVYLISNDRPFTRERLAGLAWPDWEQSQALGLLRRTLYDLNIKLPGCLVTDRHTIQFHTAAPVTVDAHTLATLATRDDPADWVQAVEIYRAPFGEGLYLNDAPELENWILREQERWQQQIVHLLKRLIARYIVAADYSTALRYARHLVAIAPWCEEAHCQIMLLLALTGQRSAALAQYRTCRKALWAELAVEPAQTTQVLHTYLQTIPQQA